ncbi:MAG: enoyl-CoA hydratase/isomerase family protein [Proteobacteria bacterium]|nr:enoyl-CoA hydratase/isomerase family protein [Pseudomonadota bacterium]MBU1740904.1 enoyl-CoA hydratase/isomerase family protein [Pseudomonadota bacterium]
MDLETMNYEKANGIGVITFNRPDRMNAVTPQFCADLMAALDLVAREDDVGCLILTGAGRAFSAGGDMDTIAELQDMAPPASRKRLMRSTAVMAKLYTLEKITIAKVNGAAVGGGAALTLACDFIVASESARFGFVFSNLGIVPDMGSMYFLPRIVGLPLAKRLFYEGNIFSAREALEMGLVSDVVAPEKLDAAADDLAGRMAAKPRASLGMMKSILQRGMEMDLESLLLREAEAQSLLWKTPDHKEAIQAFVEKRTPKFGGNKGGKDET